MILTKMLILTINKQTVPKQSTRFSSGHCYTPKNILEYQSSVVSQIINQLPENFKLIENPIELEIIHQYPYTLSCKKELRKRGITDYDNANVLIAKTTRPDVMDNLNKGLIDAMTGIIFIDDSKVWKFTACKVFGVRPQAIVKIKETNDILVKRETLTNFSCFDVIENI